MLGKHSPQRLAERRLRAQARGFLCGNAEVSLIGKDADELVDPLQATDPWMDTAVVKAPSLCSITSDAWADYLKPVGPPVLNASTPPFVPRTTSGSEKFNEPSQALIDAQKATIARLSEQIEWLTCTYLVPPPSVSSSDGSLTQGICDT